MSTRQGTSWEPEEEQRLREAFLAGVDISELASRHQRSRGAIRARLERLGLIDRRKGAREALRRCFEQPAPTAQTDTDFLGRPQISMDRPAFNAAEVLEGIDALVAAASALKECVTAGNLPDRAVRAVAGAYEKLDASLLRGEHEPESNPSDDAAQNEDPLPDRLRAALLRLLRVCVSKRRDREIAIRTLGLMEDGDGVPETLAAVGERLDISRERVRQCRVRAFRQISAGVARHVASATRLRAVLSAIAGATNLADPQVIAPVIVRFITDRFAPATQLTVICCKAAGAYGPDLLLAAETAAVEACRDPELLGKWRIDHWRDAAPRAIGSVARFDSPPEYLTRAMRKPSPGRERDTIALASEKLRRTVLCESGTELRVFTWLERCPDVRWYQEQPIKIAYYTGTGEAKFYYPDVAVWDHDGRVVVIEVKPLITMYREDTLAKAIGALRFLGPRGIGYLLVDASGRTPADLAAHPYDTRAAVEIETMFRDRPVPFGLVRRTLCRGLGSFDFRAFVSMVVNRDWAVSNLPGVHVGRLAQGLSFRTLLQSHDT